LDIVRGLEYIHTRDIMLLNLKSPNILLNAAGAKIAGGPGSCNPTIGEREFISHISRESRLAIP
jgi:serine/threonine protein kinase